MAKLGGDTACEIVCGAGTHTDVNDYGRKVAETGDWKNKRAPLFFRVKKLIGAKIGFRSWIPVENKQSSIYIRRASRGDTDVPAAARPAATAQVDYGMIDAEIVTKTAACPNAAIDTRSREDEQLEEFAKLKLKEQSGGKLSNKDRRQFEKLQRRCPEIEAERQKALAEDASSEEEGDVECDYFGNTVSR